MHWIFEHLQIVLALAAAFAYWLKQTKDKAEAEKERNTPPPLTTEAAQGEHAERTRRIQEEIRRRIADRREGAAIPSSPPAEAWERPAASSTLAPRPIARPIGGTLRERLEAKMAEALARIEDAAKAAAERERERRQPACQQEAEAAAREAEKLAAQRRAAVETLAAREERIAFAPPRSLGQETESAATVARSLRDDLRDPRSIRRAWILREVLGPPVGRK